MNKLKLIVIFIFSSSVLFKINANNISLTDYKIETDSLKVKYLIFNVNEKKNWYCTSNKFFNVKILSNDISNDLVRKIIEGYSEKIEKNEKLIVNADFYSIKENSWIIIYQGRYRFSDCDYNRNSIIILDKLENIENIIKEKIARSFIAEHYVSHKIIFKEQVKLREEDYIQKLKSFIIEVAKEYSKNLSKEERKKIEESRKKLKADGPGVRG